MNSPHDHRLLLKRWKTLARRAGLHFAMTGKARVWCVRTPALDVAGGLYISAGIHGDEAAGTEALIGWAEQNAVRLKRLPLLIFPCLNPAGLAANTRQDATGVDINRRFHDARNPVVRAVRDGVKGHRFAASLHLHEDYDASGAYLYELTDEPPWGEVLLAAAARWMARDPRGKIDGSRAANGLIRRRVTAATFARIGLPEAVWMWFDHTARSYTFETPSEFALEQRVAAHVAVIEEAVRLACGQSSAG